MFKSAVKGAARCGYFSGRVRLKVRARAVFAAAYTILNTLDELGYDVAWQVLNSKNFGVPQERKRVMLVGFLRGQCAGEVLSFTETSDAALIQMKLFPGNESLLTKGCEYHTDE